MTQRWKKWASPRIFEAREIGRITGCTNPESAELCADGETILFGNCAMMTGHPAYRGAAGLVYLEGEAFVSRARITTKGEVRLEDRHLVTGLASALAIDILPAPTRRLPAGTAFLATGGRPITKRGSSVLVEDPGDVRQQALAFAPQTGEILGRIPLWSGSQIATKFNALDQPNGLALDSKGNLFVGDITSGGAQPAGPSAVYRIPHESIDDLMMDQPGSAARVERILIPGAVNGVTVAPDGSVRAATCSIEDPIGGGWYSLTEADFSASRLGEPCVTGLGFIDGVTVTKRGTEIGSNPLTGDLHAFTRTGEHLLIRLNGDNPVPMPADINACYPEALKGEPALLVPNICVGGAPGEGVVSVLDISGL